MLQTLLEVIISEKIPVMGHVKHVRWILHQSVCYDALAMAVRRKLSEEDRREIAKNLMTWANMVFAGLVITQAFFDKFNLWVALAGVGLFMGAYLFAVHIMRGGGA